MPPLNGRMNHQTRKAVMTIESINSKIPISPRTASRNVAAVKSTPEASNADRIDTKTADRIRSALASSSTSPSVNSERVASIRQSIADGTYQVNAQRIAGKILQFEKNLPDTETSK
jgi:negative regulator of flagellin synthesis FlgM